MAELNNTDKQPSMNTNAAPVGPGSVEAAMRSAQALVGKPPVKKNYLPYVFFALALVVIAGVVYWFGLKSASPAASPDGSTAVITTQPTVTPTPTATPAPVTVKGLQDEANSLIISSDSADLVDLNSDIQGL